MSTKKKAYDAKLFQAASLVLPSVVLTAHEDSSPGEMVDTAILIARDLLAALGYDHDA